MCVVRRSFKRLWHKRWRALSLTNNQEDNLLYVRCTHQGLWNSGVAGTGAAHAWSKQQQQQKQQNVFLEYACTLSLFNLLRQAILLTEAVKYMTDDQKRKVLYWSLFHHKKVVVPAKIYLHVAMYVYQCFPVACNLDRRAWLPDWTRSKSLRRS